MGRSKIGTRRIAYVHAVANQVHTKLVPPAANLVSTTSAGSRSMSGQSNVADRTVAALAKARAPMSAATVAPAIAPDRDVARSSAV